MLTGTGPRELHSKEKCLNISSIKININISEKNVDRFEFDIFTDIRSMNYSIKPNDE
jgi:hypothetical protein